MILRMLEFSKSLKASAGKSVIAGAVAGALFYGAAACGYAAAYGCSAACGYAFGNLNSFTSAAITLPLGPVPLMRFKSRPLSPASLLARGLTKILSPLALTGAP